MACEAMASWASSSARTTQVHSAARKVSTSSWVSTFVTAEMTA
jgi:hypothetical protein